MGMATIARVFNLLSTLVPCALLLACSSVQFIEAQPYMIVQHARVQPNTVRLECRDTSSGMGTFPSDTAASFWLNDTTRPPRFTAPAGSATWTFILEREFEGRYSCGPNQQETSPSINVIYRPQFNSTVASQDEITVRVEAGRTAYLQPYVEPGLWHSRYHIDWKDSEGALVARIDGLRSSITVPSLERYSVDNGNFSLVIARVTRSDQGKYVGELGVTEGSIPYTYTPLRNTSLLVYERPTIISPPVEEVITFRKGIEDTVSFSCTARGFPTPTITWTHKNEPISSGNSRYSMSMVPMGNDDMARSMLTINRVSTSDSGQIGCIATVTPGGNVIPIETAEVVNLSVLKINKALVKQTFSGGLIFIVHVAEELPVDVFIHLAFKDAQDITSEASYSFQSGTMLPFFLDKPPFPVGQFSVNVTIMHGSQHSEPFEIISDEILNDCELTLVKIIVPSVSGLIIVVIICAVTLFYLVKCHRLKLVRLALENADNETKRAAAGSILMSLGYKKKVSKTETPAPQPSGGAPFPMCRHDTERCGNRQSADSDNIQLQTCTCYEPGSPHNSPTRIELDSTPGKIRSKGEGSAQKKKKSPDWKDCRSEAIEITDYVLRMNRENRE